MSLFIKGINPGVRPKVFIVSLPEWFCLRLSIDIFLEGSAYVSPKEVAKGVSWSHFHSIWVEISIFLKKYRLLSETQKSYCLITEMVLAWAQYKFIFWKLVHTCFWNEPPGVSDRVNFVRFVWNVRLFLKIKTVDCDQKNLIFIYSNFLVSDSEVAAYVSLKRVTELSDKFIFAQFEWKFFCF